VGHQRCFAAIADVHGNRWALEAVLPIFARDPLPPSSTWETISTAHSICMGRLR